LAVAVLFRRLCFAVLFVLPLCSEARLDPIHLRCEYLSNPLAVDLTLSPRLSWKLESSDPDQVQSAYQILVASDQDLLAQNKGNLWDSGKVSSDETTGITYEGKKPGSRAHYFWKVKVWDKANKASAWSSAAAWGAGLLKPDDWQAKFITYRDTTPVFKDRNTLFLPPSHQFRKEFVVNKSIRRATVYATALGIYELHLNGNRVGQAWFTPGWCDYRQRLYYNTYDVTSELETGRNAIGAWLADGWYAGYIGFGLLTGIGTEHIGRYTYGKTPALMAQLEIDYADGTHEVVRTDDSWKVTDNGPIQEADLLMGEFYDARKEMPGWASPGFADATWSNAIAADQNGPANATFYEFKNPPPGQSPRIEGTQIDLGFHQPTRLEPFPGVPVKHIEEIKPIAVTSPTNGVHIFNFGQNFAGIVRLKVKSAPGIKLRLRYGEMLHPDGRLMTENLRRARATDYYVCRGDPKGETYTPRFTFHGFQYVELTGYDAAPDKDMLTGIVVQSDTALTGSFVCSDEMVNRLFTNVVWTQRANFLDLPTDCPQRDERFGWTGDAQIYVRTATYNADVAAFYTKWLRDLMDSQRPSGTFPGYAPFPFQHGFDFGTAWCDAGVICPWTIWKAYGDKRVIERCWPNMVRFLEWRKKTSQNFLGVAHGNDWGDWLALNEKTPIEYIDTVYFAWSTSLMAEMATAIGAVKEADAYSGLLDKIRSAFRKKYVETDGSLRVNTQTAYALALYMNLVPQESRSTAGKILAEKIRTNDYRMATGFIGTRHLLPALSSVGQHDLAVRLLQSRRFPSWGYEVEQGATTIWERWNSYTKDNGFGGVDNAGMNSFAHYAFGAVAEWMFAQLAGINMEAAGYKRILIRPGPPTLELKGEHAPISWVAASYDSIRGRIAVSWKVKPGAFDCEVTIPPNTTATVQLPAKDEQSVTVGGKSVSNVRMEAGRAVLNVGSGSYHFSSKVDL
jgi:alpha-L-rhamnosidase